MIGCENCRQCDPESKKMKDLKRVVALAGNSNVGKSAIFTKILSAMFLAIARFVLRTHISMGPFIGAFRSSSTFVCNVNPRSDNRCTVFLSPLGI